MIRNGYSPIRRSFISEDDMAAMLDVDKIPKLFERFYNFLARDLG
jgi:hypothetical protein